MATTSPKGPIGPNKRKDDNQEKDLGKIVIELEKDELERIEKIFSSNMEKTLAISRYLGKQLGIHRKNKINELQPVSKKSFDELLLRLYTPFDIKVKTPDGGLKFFYRAAIDIRPSTKYPHLKTLIKEPITE